MTKTNQVYNSHFLLWQENHSHFPDGWTQTGGDFATKWEWTGTPDGPRAIEVIHPSGSRAGIMLETSVAIPAGEKQRWEIKVIMQTEPAGIACYIRVYLGAVSQLVFSVRPSSDPKEYSRVFSTPVGVTGLRVEVGIIGEGKVTIHEIQGWRLYPEQELRLDEKGQLFVRHIDTIGAIQTPVPVRLISPIPIPVDVKTQIRADLRDLTPSRDGIRIYGSNGNPIDSTMEGFVQTRLSGRKYVQSTETVTASTIFVSAMLQDVSQLSVYSYAVHNSGVERAIVQLQISPDAVNWTADDLECEILSGALAIFTANRFLRYVRLIHRSEASNPLRIWFQAQV